MLEPIKGAQLGTETRISRLLYSCDNKAPLYPGLVLLPFLFSAEMQHKGGNKYREIRSEYIEKA